MLRQTITLDESGAEMPVCGVEDAHEVHGVSGERGEKRTSDGLLKK
jgi:hypothetical protein